VHVGHRKKLNLYRGSIASMRSHRLAYVFATAHTTNGLTRLTLASNADEIFEVGAYNLFSLIEKQELERGIAEAHTPLRIGDDDGDRTKQRQSLHLVEMIRGFREAGHQQGGC